MTKQQIEARRAQLLAEATEILNRSEDAGLSDDDTTRLDAIEAEVQQLTERWDRLDAVERAAQAPGMVQPAIAGPSTHTRTDPFDADLQRLAMDPSEARTTAMRALEHHERTLGQATLDRAAAILDNASPRAAAEVVAHADPHYRAAFLKLVARGPAGRDSLTAEERRALERAMSLTDANGGYGVPFTLDPTWILTNDGAANPIRDLARVVTITTDTWNGVSTAGITASWDGEAGEVSDDAPTLAQPSIKAHKAQAFVPFSIEAGEDIANFGEELRMGFSDAKDRLESAAFINGAGDGSNQPTGIITALDGGSSEVSPATAEAFAVADVYSTLEALGPRFRNARTAWVAELSTINAIRQFGTANNYHAFLTDLSGDQPRRLLGLPLHEASDMDAYSGVDTGATADHHLLVVGDWRNYVVVDRTGMRVELVPHLLATGNNRPNGQRGFYAYWRVGADSVNDAGFAALNVATAA